MSRSRAHAWMVLTLAVSSGCATIDGSKEEPLTDTESPSTREDAGSNNSGGSNNTTGTTGGSTGAANGTSNGSSTGNASDGDGGASTGSTTGGTTGGTTGSSLPPDGSCNAPYELTFSAGRATAMGTTVGGPETLTPKCSPNNALTGTGVAGPDRVYHFKAPYAAEATVSATGANPLQFTASAYVVTACGNSATEIACKYDGTPTFTAASGQDYFVYVDSGASTLLGTAVGSPSGAYSLAVSLRELVGQGGMCGTSSTSGKCNADTLACRAGTCQTIACNDTFVEGKEECEDGNAAPGDGCDASCRIEGRETCANAGKLSFVAQGSSRVARASSSTNAATDDFDPTCTVNNTLDHLYTFTLAANAKVDIKLDAKFDATLVLTRGTCAPASETSCTDGAGANAVESYSGNLTAGTYFVVVDAYATNAKGEYTLTVTATP